MWGDGKREGVAPDLLPVCTATLTVRTAGASAIGELTREAWRRWHLAFALT